MSHYLHPDLTGSSNILPPDKTLAGSHLKHMEEIDVKVSFFGHLHPEGSWWISEGMNRLVNWGHLELPDRTTAIGVPAICRGANRNGVMIFDTVSNEINTMKIPRLG